MFNTPLFNWDNKGIEPPTSLKSGGWVAGTSPAPDYFNKFWSTTLDALKELQENAVDKRDGDGGEAIQKHIDDPTPHYIFSADGTQKWKYGLKVNNAKDGIIVVIAD